MLYEKNKLNEISDMITYNFEVHFRKAARTFTSLEKRYKQNYPLFQVSFEKQLTNNKLQYYIIFRLLKQKRFSDDLFSKSANS